MSTSVLADGNPFVPHFAENEKSDAPKIAIAIVGQGAGGSAALAEIVALAVRDGIADAICIQGIDAKPISEHGRGIAWGSDVGLELLANMQVDKIGSGDVTARLVPSLRSLDNVWPARADIGANLASQHVDHVRSARDAGVSITQTRGEAATIRRRGAGYFIKLTSGEEYFAHIVILALGSMPPTTYGELANLPGYIANPWEPSALDSIYTDLGERVAILGLGPTAVDTIISLRKKGVTDIHAFSRTGMMQYPRPTYQSRSALVLTPEQINDRAALHGGLTVRDILSMLADEFRAGKVDCTPLRKMLANAKLPPEQAIPLGLAECDVPNDAYAVFKLIDPVTPLIWHHLSPEERKTYLRSGVRHDHTNVGYGASTRQSRRILDYLHEGTLRVYSDVHDVKPLDGRIWISGKRQDMNWSFPYKYVVNCTGVGSDLAKVRYPLIGDMITQGMIVLHEFGGARVEFDSGQLLDRNGNAVGSIFSLIGSMTYGTHLLTHCLGETGKSAVRTANAVHNKVMALLSKQAAA